MKDGVAELLPGQHAEEPLDQLQPRRTRWHEVEENPVLSLDPFYDVGVLVDRVFVRGDVDIPVLRPRLSQPALEPKHFPVPMFPVSLADHPP